MHALAVEFLRLLQLDPQIHQTERRDHPQPESNTPRRTKVILGEDQDQDHRRESGDNVSGIDLKVCKHNKPAIPMATLEFTRALGGGDRAGRILATNANSQKESIRGQCSEKTIGTAIVTIRPGRQSGEKEQDDGRDQ